MPVAELDDVQARLENSSTVAQDLSVSIGRIRHMLHGVNGRGQFSAAQIAQEKTQVRTDIANLIAHLNATNALIH